MPPTAHDAYLESRIESAGPVELIRLLYQGAIGRVREARRALAAGDIAARSRAVTKAFEILTELATSLDRDRGGEIALRLARLYDYMQRRLIEANVEQRDQPLAEVLGLLTTLAEGWERVGMRPAAPEPAIGPWAQVGADSGSASGHAWTL